MENFFSYISKPVDSEDVKLWVDTNNICLLKLELFHDFTMGLINLIYNTYLGNNDGIKIDINSNDNENHFEWCWTKTIENFRKESIRFEPSGEHYSFFKSFLIETFYLQDNIEVKMSLNRFFNDIFDFDVMFTMSDLDLLTTIYKSLDKNIINNLQS
jgi:hypothetical protein